MFGQRILKQINSFLLFLFLLDTGGWLHVRLAVVTIFMLQYLIRSKSAFKRGVLLAWLILMLLMTPSLYNAYVGGVEVVRSVLYIYPLLVFPIFYIVFTSINVTMDTFLVGMRFFGFFVVTFFLLRVYQPSLVEGFVQILQSDASIGFFDRKTAFLGPWMPVVYFKATLIMVPAAIIAFYKKRWKDFILFFAFLVVAPSRTGVFVVMIFILIDLYKSKYIALLRSAFVLVIPIVVLILVKDFAKLFVFIMDAGAAPRLLHFPAVWNYFSERPMYFLFGGGPGSTFFTEAFIFQENRGWTDDSEISQLEVLRRYGIFFTAYLLVLFKKVSRMTRSKGFSEISYALWSYFLVAASNPVLLSTPAIVFYSIALVELSLKNMKKYENGKGIRRYSCI